MDCADRRDEDPVGIRPAARRPTLSVGVEHFYSSSVEVTNAPSRTRLPWIGHELDAAPTWPEIERAPEDEAC
jgi:hypothetical protein